MAGSPGTVEGEEIALVQGNEGFSTGFSRGEQMEVVVDCPSSDATGFGFFECCDEIGFIKRNQTEAGLQLIPNDSGCLAGGTRNPSLPPVSVLKVSERA